MESVEACRAVPMAAVGTVEAQEAPAKAAPEDPVLTGSAAAREMMAAKQAEADKKWYEKTAWILLLWFLFWPVGLVLALRSDWPRAAKGAIGIVTLLVVGTNLVFALFL